MLLIFQILIIISLALSAYMIVVTLQRCRSEKRYMFVYCIFALCLYNLGYLIEMSSGNLGGAIIGVKIMYSGGDFMAVFFFFFVADYCEVRAPKKNYVIPLLIIPVLHYCATATFDQHNLIYSSFWFDDTVVIPGIEHIPGPVYLVGQLYPILCVILSCTVLVRSIIKQTKERRMGLILLLISGMAPVIGHLAYLIVSQILGYSPLFTAFLMIISNFIFYYNVVRNDLFDVAPKAYAITMDLIRDAFVVLDRDMAYMGSNQNAVDLFPALTELHKGSSIDGLENWPKELMNKTATLNRGAESRQEIEFTLRQRPGRFYSGWENKIASESGVTLGWVILIQDVTEVVSLISNIKAQRDEIAAMRDNLKEGLFLMDRELKIQPSYSRALEEILSGKNLQDKQFTDLLSKSLNSKQLEILVDYFTMLINKTHNMKMLEEINPLSEFAYNSADTGESKTLRCIFAPVDQQGGEVFIMGTLQDISAETALKKQLAEEEARRQNEMRSLFEVMQADQKVFNDFIEDTEYEFNRVRGILEDSKKPGRQKLTGMYQSIHAIKSNAVIVGLSSYGAMLHDLETKIKESRDNDNEPGQEAMSRIVSEFEKCRQEKEKLIDIVRRLSEYNSSLNDSGKAEHANAMKDDDVFTEALKIACGKVASDEQKDVAFIVEEFDRNALRNRELRRAMKDILTQMVRNSVYHGIEKPEERRAAGKEKTGKISLSVKIENDAINIKLADDGHGLDLNRISQIAQSRGLIKNSADKTNPRFLTNIIFSPGFSTSKTENMHAGRGIGLNFVKDRLREVNGSMRIDSIKGQGLTYNMKIPIQGK